MDDTRTALSGGLARNALPLALGAAVVTLHVATAALWGWDYFRDELYYIACGRHLDFGYVDHPPLVGLVARLTTGLLGTSLTAIRLPPALAAGATVACAVVLCRRFGGGTPAQVLTAVATALAPVYVALFGYFSMNAFDVLIWTAALTLVAHILALGAPAGARQWPAFGVLAGIGLLNKLSVLFLGFGVLVGLVLARQWGHLRARSFWLAGLVAALVFAPHVVWQIAHGWPTLEFMRNATGNKNVALAPLEFLAAQLELLNPLTAPLWLAGLGFFLVAPAGRPWRALGFAYLVVLTVMLTWNAKPYYLAPIYPLLFAAGAAWLATAATSRARQAVAWAAAAIVGLSGLAIAPLVKPVLPLERTVAYAAALGQEPSTDERKRVGRLDQFFADRLGWRTLAATVAEAYAALPAADRARACAFGQNYGQAGALDLYRGTFELPPAISGHNSYWLWGPGPCTGDVVIVLGDDQERLEELFAGVELAAVHPCTDCMPYETDRPVWICREPRGDLRAFWPEVKHFD